ncbi:MAG: FAD-dependent oxidoreductase [Thermodesulfobacteriota bacterium]|nr:FAD-dependent oxidoreductase [Thermodesulfobacteriota bacterium]
MNNESLHIVIVGNGIAGNSAASAIRKNTRKAAITMVSNEPFPAYSACALSKKFMSGEMKREDVFLKSMEDYSSEGIRTLFNQSVTGLDFSNKQVLLRDGSIEYDKLIIATGGKPIVPPIEGRDKREVFTLKSLENAEAICNSSGRNCVVIGPGVIGVEASASLKKRGWAVRLIGGRYDRILRQVFDEKPSAILKQKLNDLGIDVFTGERPAKFDGNTVVQRLITDKSEIECDMAVLALGIMPEVGLAEKSGIEIGSLGGIKTDEQMRTNIEDVYACGDCVETRDVITGKNMLCLLWYNARQQGDIAGCNAIGIRRKYCGTINIRGLHIGDIYAASIGHTMESFDGNNVDLIESREEDYRGLVVADGIIVGAQFVGRNPDVGPLIGAIRRRDSLKKLQTMTGNIVAMNPLHYTLYPGISKSRI